MSLNENVAKMRYVCGCVKLFCMTYEHSTPADTDRRKISYQDYKFASDGLRLFELKPGVSSVQVAPLLKQ